MKSLVAMRTDNIGFNTTASPSILLIEPRRSKRSSSAVQLTASRFSFITVHEARDIYLMSGSIQILCAVLSDEIGPDALQASAEAVRWQWPKTHIVILGRPGELGDHLYDDCVDLTSEDESLVGKLEDFLKNSSKYLFSARR